MSTSVQIENVTKRFGNFVPNDHVNLNIEAGDFVSLLGPSGCGKTTLLSMILGVQDITEGKIYFDDTLVSEIPIHKRDVGMVFQNYALFPHMTVEDNVAFGLKMRKLPKEQITSMVTEALEMVHMQDLRKRFPRELSGGQQQRVAFARAIVVKPRVLLLDEPLSNLDAKLREEMRFELKKLHKMVGITTIYVTHDQIEALSLSTKIAVMNKGVVQQYGTPLEIFLTPGNPFVAEFVGYANFLKGKIIDIRDQILVIKDEKYGYTIEADVSHMAGNQTWQVGENVMSTIKPENIVLMPGDVTPAGANVFEVMIGLNDYTGNATRYEMETKEKFEIKASVSGYSDYATGTKAYVHFPKDKLTIIKISEG